MAFFLAPSADARPQFFDSQGNVLAGGFMYWFAAGTTTPQDTYTTSAGSVANPHPITLDAAGRPPTGIYLTEGLSYKLVVKDSAANTIFTQDNIVGITTALTNNEWASSGLTPTYISATSFSFPGDQTTDAHKQRRLKVVDAGGTKYATITGSAFTTLTTVTVDVDSGGSLQTPITSVSWGIITATNPSISPDAIHRKADSIASAATTDIWAIAGDFVHVTGSTGPITSFGTAPYAGAVRTVIFDSTPTITHNATTLQLPGGANIVAVAGDRAVVRADTTANMVVIAYEPATVTGSGSTVKATSPTLTTPTLTSPTLSSPVINTAVTGTAIATQAQQEAGTATDVLVTPGRQHFHKGHAKAWASVDQSGVQAVHDSYGVTSIADAGVGVTTVNFTTSFSSINVCVVGSAYHGAGTAQILRLDSIVAASLNMTVVDASFNAVDSAFAAVACFGDFA